jgi:hypothetical protein
VSCNLDCEPRAHLSIAEVFQLPGSSRSTFWPGRTKTGIGWEAGSRTPILWSRARCPTIERPPSKRSNRAAKGIAVCGTPRTRRGAGLFYEFARRAQHKNAAALAGEGGFEPPNVGSKGRCLTTWRLPTAADPQHSTMQPGFHVAEDSSSGLCVPTSEDDPPAFASQRRRMNPPPFASQRRRMILRPLHLNVGG